MMNNMSRILAVDDDKDILEALQLVLEDYGYEVNTLADGHQLFDVINKEQPDLILMDIMLNGLDGRDLCKNVKLNDKTHTIPVIMISASHNVGDVLKQECAPDDFLAKPFDISMLINKIQRQLAA